MDGKMGKSLIQEMHIFDDDSVAVRSGPAWIIWEPRDGLECWASSADPGGILWDECDAASFIATKGQRSKDSQDEVSFVCG